MGRPERGLVVDFVPIHVVEPVVEGVVGGVEVEVAAHRGTLCSRQQSGVGDGWGDSGINEEWEEEEKRDKRMGVRKKLEKREKGAALLANWTSPEVSVNPEETERN